MPSDHISPPKTSIREYDAIFDTIVDAEIAVNSHAYLYSPVALEIIRARHKRARELTSRLIYDADAK